MNRIKIKNHIISGNRTFIIAEAGSNHNGVFDNAKELIDIAVEAGADAVKFQSYDGDSLVQKDNKAYQILNKFRVPYEWHYKLNEYCKEKNILFCSTPFDYEKLNWLKKIDVPFIKIASGDITYIPFLKKVAELNKPIILSTGMANLGEVEEAVNTIINTGNEDIILLHCVGKYPAKINELNLNILTTLRNTFDFPVGFSDHTMSTIIPAMAVSMGAKVIEKHFTLDKNLDTPDHSFSLNPNKLKEMIKNIRLAEAIKGSKIKKPSDREIETSRISARRSIYTKLEIKKGEIITNEKIIVIRPARGLKPKYLSEVIGKKTRRKLKSYEPITCSDVEW